MGQRRNHTGDGEFLDPDSNKNTSIFVACSLSNILRKALNVYYYSRKEKQKMIELMVQLKKSVT